MQIAILAWLAKTAQTISLGAWHRRRSPEQTAESPGQYLGPAFPAATIRNRAFTSQSYAGSLS